MSALVHLGLLILLIAPFAANTHLSEIEQGAGGPGPAGGGGGGKRERINFIRVAPAAPAPPKVEIIQPPKLPIPEQPLPQISLTQQVSVLPPMPSAGTGVDNSNGTGPGSGGGVGAGIGTGKGSAVGPGTGGGNQANYPPVPTDMFIPPLPVPASVKGFHLIAEFDVDESGKVLGLAFNETPDRGYNKRLTEVLRGFRFRPGTKPDGTPVRMKAQVIFDLY